jgi:hypothetical protein
MPALRSPSLELPHSIRGSVAEASFSGAVTPDLSAAKRLNEFPPFSRPVGTNQVPSGAPVAKGALQASKGGRSLSISRKSF